MLENGFKSQHTEVHHFRPTLLFLGRSAPKRIVKSWELNAFPFSKAHRVVGTDPRFARDQILSLFQRKIFCCNLTHSPLGRRKCKMISTGKVPTGKLFTLWPMKYYTESLEVESFPCTVCSKEDHRHFLSRNDSSGSFITLQRGPIERAHRCAKSPKIEPRRAR